MFCRGTASQLRAWTLPAHCCLSVSKDGSSRVCKVCREEGRCLQELKCLPRASGAAPRSQFWLCEPVYMARRHPWSLSIWVGCWAWRVGMGFLESLREGGTGPSLGGGPWAVVSSPAPSSRTLGSLGLSYSFPPHLPQGTLACIPSRHWGRPNLPSTHNQWPPPGQ
jgi:hypothetical protein